MREILVLKHDAILRRLATNWGWLLSDNVVSLMLRFAQNIIIARLLGVDQYGVFVLITTYTVTISQVMDSRSWDTAIKYVVQHREALDFPRATAIVKICYLIDLVTGIAAFAALCFSADFATSIFLKDPAMSGLVVLYALSALVAIPNGTSLALLRINNHFDWIAYQNMAISGLKLIAVALCAFFGGQLVDILLAYLIVSAISTLSIVVLGLRAGRNLNLTPWRQAPLKLLRDELKGILKFTLLSNIAATSRIVVSRVDVLLVGWLTAPVVTGWYSLAKNLAEPALLFFSSVYTATYPEFSQLVAANNIRRLRTLQRNISLTLVAMVVPLCIAGTFATPWIIPFVFGSEFLPSVPLVQLMLWQTVWIPLIWLPGLLLSLEKGRLLVVLNWIDAVNFVALLLLLIPVFGVTGAALATVLRAVVWVVLAWRVIVHVNSHALAYERDRLLYES